MIEKIMKAVKSGNKKRGRNITIGAVVGMLLSCTAVMGADKYLWVKENVSGSVEFSTNSTDGTNGDWDTKNPYEGENSWDETTKIYVNNMTLSVADNGDIECGIISEEGVFAELINNGKILATGTHQPAGIGALGDNKGNITNNGLILGEGTVSAGGFGIFIEGNNSGEIINNGIILGIGVGSERSEGIFIEDGFSEKNIINNGIIHVENSTGESQVVGITLENNKALLENNGIISAKGQSGIGIIMPTNEKIVTNNGLITVSGRGRGMIAGFAMEKGDNEGLISNNGMIISNGDNGDVASYGMFVSNIGALVNNGLIKSIAAGREKGDGIYLSTSAGEIINSGVITGKEVTGQASGIEINDPTGKKYTNNLGVIYGDSYAIKARSAYINNYGILGTKGAVVSDVDSSLITNYGLYITEATGIVTAGSSHSFNDYLPVDYIDESTGLERQMYVKNAEIEAGNTSTKSFEFSDSVEEYNNSIINGKDETLKVIGDEKEVSGSIINAYETAIRFDDNQDNQLTLSGTVVNGGIEDGSFAVLGGDSSDTLIIQSGEVEYKSGNKNKNTVINGDINLGAGNDTLIVGVGSVINGELQGGDGEDNLNFGIVLKSRSTLKDEIKVLRDISEFENININENTSVTFFENVKVKGVDTLTIAETGVLNLRLKDSGTKVDVGGDMVSKAEHAFLGNEMIIQGEGNGIDIAGTMNFVTNGIGRRIYVDMTDIELKNLYIKTSSIIDGYKITEKESLILGAYGNLEEIYRPEDTREKDLSKKRYESLNNIYKGIYSSKDENLNALRTLISFNNFGNNYEENMSDEEQLKNLMSYLNSIYTESPYSFSSELSRRSAGMFRDIVTENEFRPNLNNWLIMGGLTHADGGTKDTYYGRNYHEFDTGTSDTNADMKLTGAYMLAKYGYSENTSLGLTLGGNKSEAKMDMSKVKGNSGYLGVFAENYRGNLTLKAGAGIQYSEYDADRRTIGGHSYNDKYSDMTYDIYLNGRYSHQVGDNLFLEPYATLSYTYVDQDGADEGSKVLAIETDSKSFDYTVGKVGVDLKKVIPHEKGKSTLSAGVSYTKILDGADEEHITGRFKGGSDFDILVAHKNEHSIGLNAKYALELENGVIFDVKGTYSVERDSHNQSGKNRTKGEWIVGAGIGYKF